MDILAGVTVVRGTFSSLPVHSGILWEGSCLVSFWISCETELAWLPGTEKSYLIFKELKTTVYATEYCTGNYCFGLFVWISGISSLLRIAALPLDPSAAVQSGNHKTDSGLNMTFWPSLNVFGMKWEFSSVQIGERMRNIQSTIQQCIENDILL